MTLQGMSIVEYAPSYAKGISQMWERSNAGWNGSDMSQSEDSVRNEHENSTDLNVYLAVKGSEVIGYCAISKFTRDQHALYIRLLNVCPQHHGKGIGKALVLKCVERTIELGYSQLDLYTWPGNTKAVPLYKKCGFFWEKREDATHLMNFIPAVLGVELVESYFRIADWYEDSVRPLDVSPDGRGDNGFEYFEYGWNKDGSMLRVEFERTGRGIRLVETDDYQIEASVAEHGLVFGQTYFVQYRIQNKSGKPLRVALCGRNDRNISYSLSEEYVVNDQIEVAGEFYLGEVEEPQDSWESHPAVTTEVTVNGKKVEMKVGVEPKYPVACSMVVPGQVAYEGVEATAFFDLESSLPKEAAVTFALPASSHIAWEQETVTAHLPARGRVSVPVRYTLHQHTILYEPISFDVVLDGGGQITFSRLVTLSFPGYGGVVHSKLDNAWVIGNGVFSARLDTKNNRLRLTRLGGHPSYILWDYPKLGKPYSSEFSHRKPHGVRLLTEGEFVTMRADYHSTDYAGVIVSVVSRLRGDGMFEHFYEVQNQGGEPFADGLWLSDTVYFDAGPGVIPYDRRFVSLDDTADQDVYSWNGRLITENWLFFTKNGRTAGLTWPEDAAMQFADDLVFAHNLSGLAPGQVYRTKPIVVAIDTFPDWRGFRQFARKLQSWDQSPLLLSSEVEAVVNGGNPFVGRHYRIGVTSLRPDNRNLRIHVSSHRQEFSPATIIGRQEVTRTRSSNVPLELLRLNVRHGALEYQRETAIFAKGEEGRIAVTHSEEQGLQVYQATNGCLSIKVAPEFAPTLFSLQDKEGEWLDSAFPKPRIMAWWNPWAGGVETTVNNLAMSAMLKEKRRAEFVVRKDSVGNTWEGIGVTIEVEHQEKMKGLILRLYYLLLPDSPVLLHGAEILQNTGKYLNNGRVQCNIFPKLASELEQSWIRVEDEDGSLQLRCGDEQRFARTRLAVECGSDQRRNRLLVYANPERTRSYGGVGTSFQLVEKETTFGAKHGQTVLTTPVFLILASEAVPHAAFRTLDSVYLPAKQVNR